MKVYAIAESRPLDAILFHDMRMRIDELRALDVSGFRTSSKHGYFSAVDIIRQGLEIFFELTPSKKRFLEARGLIRVHTKKDPATMNALMDQFAFFADAVLALYSAERHIEFLGPRTIFLEGVAYPIAELEATFKVIGVKPPRHLVKPFRRMVYLDEDYPPYREAMEKRIRPRTEGREEHWLKRIVENLPEDGKTLLKVGAEHLSSPKGLLGKLRAPLGEWKRGRLSSLLAERGITVEVVHEIPALHKVYGIK